MDVTKEIAEQCFAAIVGQFNPEEGYGPKLIENWDWLDSGPTPWAIVWEEGPYEWALRAQSGGTDPEFGTVTPEAENWPEGVFAEAATSWAVGIYPV